MASAARDPITCHALDTVKGKPAAGIAVQLRLVDPLGPSSEAFTATTDADGRVKSWAAPAGPSLSEIFAKTAEHPGKETVWTLTFATGEYFGSGNTFFPKVDITFAVKAGEEHYHVPLLLGPWSYTTYRGS